MRAAGGGIKALVCGLALALVACGDVTSPAVEELNEPGPRDASYDGALSFDGVDDYASIGTARMPQITYDQSLLLLLRPEGKLPGGPDVQALFTLRRGRSSGIVLALDGDVPFAYNVYGDRELARASGPLALDTWHQLAFVVQSDSCTLYVDGAQADTTDSGPLTNRTPLESIIGSADGYGQAFHGALDELRVYSRALGPDEITAVDAGDPPDDAEQLVLYLPFNEMSGARSYDRSGLENHAELGDGVPELMPARIRANR